MLEFEGGAGPGDYVITVESPDRAFIREIWSLRADGITLRERGVKSGDWPGLIAAAARDIPTLIEFVKGVARLAKGRAALGENSANVSVAVPAGSPALTVEVAMLAAHVNVSVVVSLATDGPAAPGAGQVP